jgi:hypothetical protein
MAKSQTSYATNASNNLVNQAQNQTAPIISGLTNLSNLNQATSDIQGGMATTGFGQQQVTGGYDPTQLGTLRSNTANLASTGGYDPTQLSGLQSGLQSATSTGGYNPQLLNQVVSGTQQGYDPTSLSTLRGGYSNLANTGGYTPAMQSAYLNQATSGLDTTYNQLEQQSAQSAAKTGTSSGAAISQMARQLGQAQASTTQNATLGLQQQITANELSGLGGLGTTEANVTGLGLQGTGILANTAANQASGTLQGLGQQSALQTNVAGARSSGVGQQVGLESGVAAGSNAANSGLAGLYNTTTGNITAEGQQVLSALGLNFGTQSQAINALVNLSKNPGTIQTILSQVQGLGGAAAGILGAIA